MIEKPQFKPHFHVEIVNGEGVFLISEIGHSVLSGRLFSLVAPLINGSRSADEIAEALHSQLSAAEVYYALMLLEQKGHIIESDQALPANEAAFWAMHDISARMASCRLAEVSVAVTAFGDVAPQPLLALLADLSIRVSDHGDLGVVLTDNYLHEDLRTYNREALRRGHPWMLIQPSGRTILIGPVFYPGTSACWECLAHRLRINRSVEAFVQRKQARKNPFPVPKATTAAIQQIAVGMAATEISKWIARKEAPRPEVQILAFDILSWRTQMHPVVRQPHCTACGDSSFAHQNGKGLLLESRKKVFIQDGGHRAVTPSETLQKYERHVSPISGAVGVLQPHPSGSNGVIHIYVAGDNRAALHHDLKHIQWSLRSRSAGKGITDTQAKASALCESLERYSGVFQGTESRHKASFKKLGGIGIHPNDCMRFSEMQYRQRQTINATSSYFHFVPLPFDENAEIEWTPVWSMTNNIYRYLPTEYCYFNYPSPKDRVFCVGCSNGNAAGNTLEEAILHGFFELVERDSVALWWYNRARRPEVDVESFDESYLVRFKRFLMECGRHMWVLDLTTDLGVPTFAAVSRRTDQPQEQIILGFGAHLDARIAVLRAVTELSQSLTWVLPSNNGITDISKLIEDPALRDWIAKATIANQSYLVPDDSASPRTAGAYQKIWTDDLKDDVILCEGLVERHGMEMLVLDQTRADIGLPVVKVIVPGLRHFWARFASGRLYDVPPALGWINGPLSEEQLNPIPMFM